MRRRATGWLAGLVGVVLLGGLGCAGRPRPALTLQPVGPLTGSRSLALTRGSGHLEVYTVTEPYDDGGFVYYRHTPYSVYDDAGNRVKSVVNRVGMTDQRPMTVALPAGRYRVWARAAGYGLVEVPVVIAASRVTEVHLDRRGYAGSVEIPAAESVRLPDGRVVGRTGPPLDPAADR